MNLEIAIANLRRRRDRNGTVRTADVQRVADCFDVSVRTVWRQLNNPRTRAIGARQLTTAEMVVLAQCNGQVSSLARKLAATDPKAPSERTLQRAALATLGRDGIAFLRLGIPGLRAMQLYQPFKADHVNQYWQADSWMPPIHLRTDKGKRKVRCWICCIIDVKSRRIVGWSLMEVNSPQAQPTEELALEALAVALADCGSPDIIVPDNGSEFQGNRFGLAAATWDFAVAPTAPYEPHQKGVIERFFGTAETEFLHELPFYIRGARQQPSKLYAPESGPLSVSEFAQLFGDWITSYNNDRRHSAHRGKKTPLQVWTKGVARDDWFDVGNLWTLLPQLGTRVVGKAGVLRNNLFHYAPELDSERLVTHEVEMHAHRYDERRTWLVRNGALVGIATPWDDQGVGAKAGLLTSREAREEQLVAIRTAADADTELQLDAMRAERAEIEADRLRRVAEIEAAGGGEVPEVVNDGEEAEIDDDDADFEAEDTDAHIDDEPDDDRSSGNIGILADLNAQAQVKARAAADKREREEPHPRSTAARSQKARERAQAELLKRYGPYNAPMEDEE